MSQRSETNPYFTLSPLELRQDRPLFASTSSSNQSKPKKPRHHSSPRQISHHDDQDDSFHTLWSSPASATDHQSLDSNPTHFPLDPNAHENHGRTSHDYGTPAHENDGRTSYDYGARAHEKDGRTSYDYEPRAHEKDGRTSSDSGARAYEKDGRTSSDYGPPLAQRTRPNRERNESGDELWAPAPHRTMPLTWCGAVLCSIVSLILLLLGLIVLIMYVYYRPHNPRFDINTVTLNAAYLDAGSLVNVDAMLDLNFTNPNRRMSVEFRDLLLDLYFEDSLIATQYITPFKVPKSHTWLTNVRMVARQVYLPLKVREKLQSEIAGNAIVFQVRGLFRVHSYLAKFLKYSYTLYGYCTFVVSYPFGVTTSVKCRSKR